jgi:galactokinase/galacturonokinase
VVATKTKGWKIKMRCEEVYEQLYHHAPEDVVFCPYRISPLGAHIDHQWGKINGLAIDKGIHIAYRPKQNGVIEVQSLDFAKRAQFHVCSVEEEKVGDWADYLRGATKILGEKYKLSIGLSAVIEGSLPIGGLSSSAAVIICFLSALCKVNNLQLSPMEMIMTAKAAENQYVGVACGKLDQSCEVLSLKDHLLYMDTKDDSFETIPTCPDMKPYKIAIIFSGLERTLVNSKYNLRQDECKAAAYALMGYAGMDYGSFAEARLRDVPREVYESYGDRLPDNWRKRANHYYSEFARAEAGAELWRKGDLDRYGELVFESGRSSIDNYECGSDEMKKLYEIMSDTKGVYGGRFSGAGFKGCCMALIDPEYSEYIEAKISEKYLKAFPKLEGKYSFHLCDSANGVAL